VQNTAFSRNITLNIGGRLIELNRPALMGILNVTPDSFFDGGRYANEQTILERAEKLLKEGATFLDVGGYSSRPGAKDISIAEEIERVIPAIKNLVRHFPNAIISIDTFRSEVADRAVNEGAKIINDISGGALDDQMIKTAARLNVPYIFMHMKGSPQTMNQLSHYDNLMKEIITYFHQRLSIMKAQGIKDIIIDPGFGFAKTREHNFELLNQLDSLKIFGRPILAGLSRKSMVWKTLGIEPEDALNGTTMLNTIALTKGANILRVHDVREAMEVIKLWEALNQNAQ
jgi:dihydropteroate synthase